MFESLTEPLPNPAAYWERIGLAPIDARQLDAAGQLQALDQMILAHQLAVPFENLQIFEQRETPSLGIADLFDKVVTRSRGGYCFELNALFAALLADAGFAVRPLAGRSLKDYGYVQPLMHRANVVEIDGKAFFCDVGYGGPQPSCALPLADGARRTASGQVFCLRKEPQGSWWQLNYCGRAHGPRATPAGQAAADVSGAVVPAQPGEVPVLALLDQQVYPQDFVVLSHYCSTHPNAVFTQKRMLNRRTPTGNVSLTADALVQVDGGQRTERAIGQDELDDVLQVHFGIVR